MISFHLHGYGEFDETRRIGPATWPHFDLLVIHRGHVTIQLRGREVVELRDGESVLIYPQTPFEGRSLAPRSRASVQHFAIAGRAGELRPPFDRLAGLRRGFRRYGAEAGRRAEADIDRAVRLSGWSASPIVHEMRVAVLTLILGELGDGVRPPIERRAEHGFEAVISWAEQNLRRGPTVEDLARRAGLSPSYFRSVFAKRLGRSAGAFLLDLRMREAARLLRETRTPIKQLAPQTGYGDIATFYHAFRRHFGVTPAAYRTRYAPRG